MSSKPHAISNDWTHDLHLGGSRITIDGDDDHQPTLLAIDVDGRNVEPTADGLTHAASSSRLG